MIGVFIPIENQEWICDIIIGAGIYDDDAFCLVL